MRHDAIETVVGAGGGNHDHLALGLGQPTFFQHQRIVVREECAELVGPMRERQKDIRYETSFLLHLEHARPDVVGQVLEFWDWIAAD